MKSSFDNKNYVRSLAFIGAITILGSNNDEKSKKRNNVLFFPSFLTEFVKLVKPEV